MSIGAALGESGGTVGFDHEGRRYEVSLVTQSHKARLEKRVVERAEAILERFRALLPEKEYTEESLTLYREVRAGKYSFGSAVSQGAMKGDDFVYFCSLLFGIPEEEMERLVLSASGKVTACINHVIALSFPVEKPKSEGAEGNVEAARTKTKPPTSPP